MIQRRKTRPIQLGKLSGRRRCADHRPVDDQDRHARRARDRAADLGLGGGRLRDRALRRAGARSRGTAGRDQKKIRIPLVADIHFNYKLALIAIEQGVDGLRLNPGNIGARKYVEEVVKAASERKIPIRIGVNAGSLEKDLLQKYNGPTAEGMVESGLRHIRILEDVGYQEIKISLKASDPLMMIEAYRMLADKVDYPFHLGVTEAGTPGIGTIKSAIGLGTLLAEGIGDTIRVSLAADPVEEVRVGMEILKALKIRKEGMTFVACPSCGRADVDLVGLGQEGRRKNAALQQS